ncbi:MAG TPA: hypothetical protein PKW80_10085 [Bacteroidales bacterium]|nr:hypothetical protein [Bacteroidales bacterium]
MKKVNLELSAEQYKELLKLVYVGDWVIDEPENIVLNDLVQTIFSKAEEAGLKKLIDFDQKSGLFLPALEFDEEIIDIVDDYEEECFWDHLIYRLAERDVENNLGEKAKGMSMEDKMDLLDPLTERYLNEFEENGLDNVEVKIKK